jgi:hypothetical protein
MVDGFESVNNKPHITILLNFAVFTQQQIMVANCYNWLTSNMFRPYSAIIRPDDGTI